MIKTLFMALAYFYASLFASAPLTDKEDVDQYITTLKAALPGRADQDCFFNLCDMAKCSGVITFPHPVYYFVDKEYVAECPKQALDQEFGSANSTVYGDLRAVFRDFFRDKQKFFKDFSEKPSREVNLGCHFLAIYRREPFLRALEEPVVVCDSLDLLRQYAELLTTSGMRAVPSFGDLDVTRPVAPVTQQRVTRASKDPRAQAAAESAKKKLDARRAAQNVLVPAPPPVSVVVEEVKPTSSATAAVVAKDKEKRTRKRKGTRGNSAAVAPLGLKLVSPSIVTAPTAVTADADGDVVMKIKPSPQDSKPVLMEEDSAEEDPRYPLAAVLPQVLMPSATSMADIVKGLTPEQRMAMEAYAGTGMSFEQQYEQACKDGIFAALRSPTPARSAARSVSISRARTDPSRANSRMRRPSDVDDAVRAPTPSSRSTSRMRGASECEDEVMRAMTPARMQRLIIRYESAKVQKKYEEFFSHAQNACAKRKWDELQRNLALGVCPYYPNFASVPGAKKIEISEGGRIVFTFEENEEGRVVTFYKNPKHYGD